METSARMDATRAILFAFAAAVALAAPAARGADATPLAGAAGVPPIAVLPPPYGIPGRTQSPSAANRSNILLEKFRPKRPAIPRSKQFESASYE